MESEPKGTPPPEQGKLPYDIEEMIRDQRRGDGDLEEEQEPHWLPEDDAKDAGKERDKTKTVRLP